MEKHFELLQFFDGRYLKDDASWTEDIYPALKRFVAENLDKHEKYQFRLDTHSSIAFAVGRIMDSRSGFDACPVQKDAKDGLVLWDIDNDVEIDCNWDVKHLAANEEALETALILNVSKNIYDDVIDYINNQHISVAMIINCTPKAQGASGVAIKNGTQAYRMAESIYEALTRRTTPQRRSTLHVFSAAPNGFMFFLGKVSRGFGDCVLYEYDFEQRRSCTYDPSIRFTD